MRWTIRRKLILAISLPLLMTYIGILAWDYKRQREIATQFMQDMVLTRARLTVGLIEGRLESAERLTETVAGVMNRSSSAMDALPWERGGFRGVIWENEWAVAAAVILDKPAEAGGLAATRSGFVLRRSRESGQTTRPAAMPVAGRSVEGRLAITDLTGASPARTAGWYRTVMETRQAGWFGPEATPGIMGGLSCVYAVPLKTTDGVEGVAAVFVPSPMFRRAGTPLLRAEDPLEERSAVATSQPVRPAMLLSGRLSDYVILDSSGRFVYHPAHEQPGQVDLGERSRIPAHVRAGFLKAVRGESNVVRAENLAVSIPGYRPDEDYWLAYVPMRTTRWVFATAVPESDQMAPVLTLMAKRAGLLMVGLLAMLGVVVVMVSEWFSRPIERLAAAIERVGRGDLDSRLPEGRGTDEVAKLFTGFNAMVGQIRQQMERIRRDVAAREKTESELRVARQIQTDLLPKTFPPFPNRPEFDLYAINLAAEHVAGDFYDFFFVDERRLMIVIADAAGKGVPAAIMMAVTRTLIRNLATSGFTLSEVIRQTNAALVADTPANMFVTMILCEYDVLEGRLRYVNAGHPTAILLSRDGAASLVAQSTAPLVGAWSEWTSEDMSEGVLVLGKGDTLVMYTDGLSEATVADGTMLGETGALEVVCRHAGEDGPQTLCRNIVAEVEEQQGAGRHDDLTLVALRRN